MRAANEQRVLATVREGWGRSQADLARATGLSPAAVSGIVARLVARGEVSCTTEVSRGRRVRVVSAAAGSEVFAGVDIGRSHARLLVGDGSGRVLEEREQPLAPGHRPTTTLATVRDQLEEMVAGSAGGRVLRAIGVGLPGPLDREHGAVVGGTILPGWVGVPVTTALAPLAADVRVENDANLGALASAAQTGARDLVHVKAGSGLGAGLVVGGRLHPGAGGLAGELGHVAVSDAASAPMCRCGRRGCLETYASTEVLARTLSTVLDRRVPLSRVVAMGASADPIVRRVFDDSAEAVGRGLGILCTLLDPGLVVLGGPLAGLGHRWLQPVRAGFARSALPAVVSHTSIQLSPLGERAEALGALQLARTSVVAAAD
nr:ROK family transcriptional regulator [Nocardioides flavescens]